MPGGWIFGAAVQAAISCWPRPMPAGGTSDIGLRLIGCSRVHGESMVVRHVLHPMWRACRMLLLLVVLLLLVFAGGGGYYGYNQWGLGGGVGILLLVIVLFLLFGRGHFSRRI